MKANKTLFMLLFLFLCKSVYGQPFNDDLVRVGQKAPTIEPTTTIEGHTFELKENNEQLYVINFWFIACGPCRKEIPELNKLAREFRNNKKVSFIAISNIDNEKSLKYVKEKLKLEYNQIPKGQSIADRFGISMYPTNIVIDKNGVIKFFRIGYDPDIKSNLKTVIKNNL